MAEVSNKHLRDYFLFNYDNDYRTMIDNSIIGLRSVEQNLTPIFNSGQPEYELEQLLAKHNLTEDQKNSLKKFIFEIKIDDGIALADKDHILAIGVVESNYRYTPNTELPHARKVRWLFQGKLNIEDGNQRIRIRKVSKEITHDIIEEKINEALISEGDNGLLINYISHVTTEQYLDFFKKVTLNPHELELLNIIYYAAPEGVSIFELQKLFDGVNIETSLEKLARKISRRFKLGRIDDQYIPNILNGVLRDGHICLLLKKELSEALEKADLIDKSTLSSSDYTIKHALVNSVYPASYFEEILCLLKEKRSIHLTGPWGTGKSYFARRLAYLINGHRDVSNILHLQMHSAQTYNDLLCDEGSRILYRFIERARKDTMQNFVIILEDCHEVHLSTILGEIEYLLEDNNREKEAALDVSFDDKKYYIPQNIYVIKTSREVNHNINSEEFSNVLIVDMEAMYNQRFINMFNNPSLGIELSNTFTKVNAILEDYSISINHGLFLKKDRGITLEEYDVVIKYKLEPLFKRLIKQADYDKIFKLINSGRKKLNK